MELGGHLRAGWNFDNCVRNGLDEVGVADDVVGVDVCDGLGSTDALVCAGSIGWRWGGRTLLDDGTRTPTAWPWSTPSTERPFRTECETIN